MSKRTYSTASGESDDPSNAVAASAASSAASSSSSTPATALKAIEQLEFDNLALRALPVDKETRNFTREVKGACFSIVEPTPVQNPQLICVSEDVLRWIQLKPSEVARSDFAEYFSGNKIIPGARPAAHCYCGHQFGHFSGQLGDGATMYLGEILTSGNTKERIEIQFKGAGQTPYSRRADGRKVLRSSLREFLCSEANHYLGIPSTRAGTIVTSDTRVDRDLFYDGNTIQERATIITRLAHSFIRFGSFEIAKSTDNITGRAGPSAGNHALVKQLLDYVVDTFYAKETQGMEGEEKYLTFLRTLVRRTAYLVAKWQSVGWCHGVLNTDNMSILGITIDYGPFGYMESFDPEYICNASDSEGRYRYEAQPEICGWNLWKLTQNFESFIDKAKMMNIVGDFETIYQRYHFEMHCDKLGLNYTKVDVKQIDKEYDIEDETEKKHLELIEGFYSTLQETGGDFTNCFRILSQFQPYASAAASSSSSSSTSPATSDNFQAVLELLVQHSATLQSKLATLAPRIPPAQLQMLVGLMRSNPEIFSRPDLADQLNQIQEEMARAESRKEWAKKPVEELKKEHAAAWSKWLESYQKALLADIPSSAKADVVSYGLSRKRKQNAANPKYILRNWIAQQVIDQAEKGNYGPVKECLERLKDPYDIDDKGAPVVSAAAAAAGTPSVNELEEKAVQSPAFPSTKSIENQQDLARHLTPKETQCAIHWGGQKPEWAHKLRVT